MNFRRAASGILLAFGLAFAAMLVPAQGRAQDSAEAASAQEILVMLRMPPVHHRLSPSYGGDYGDAASQAARRRVALQIARENGLELLEGWPMPLVGVDCFVMRVPSGTAVEAVIDRVSRHRHVAWSQPMHLYHTRNGAQGKGDPLFPVQPAAEAWRLADLHRVATGRGVTVAVVDSRIDAGHPDLAGQIVSQHDFVSRRSGAAEEHGTGIAGIIAAKAGNGLGIAGIAPGARLMALRACVQTDRAEAARPATCDTLSLAKALHHAIEKNADVINLSLSGPADPLLSMLIERGLARRISVVAAFDPALPNGGFPASQAGVIAAADESLPSLPPRVYGAPGRDVPTTQPGGRWYLVNGSSFAAAHVSGLLALVRELRKRQVSEPLLARSPGGAVNACATINALNAECRCSCGAARQAARFGRQ